MLDRPETALYTRQIQPELARADTLPPSHCKGWNSCLLLGTIDTPRELESASCTCFAGYQAVPSQAMCILWPGVHEYRRVPE
jgi:hypothetical protein